VDPSELVATLAGQGVVVREIPGRGLVRASCGWWTSEDDLRRLAEGVAGG
jgi:selenocysteine lyase/cysteine desulfurase